MKKSYHHCHMSIFLSELLIFSTHMHNTFRSIKSDSPPCLPASWSSLEEFGNFEDCTAFYIKIDNADPMLLLDLDQTPAKYLHLRRSCSPAFLDLFQFSDLHSNNPFLVTSPFSLCLTNTFQSISQAIADPLAKKWTSKWLKNEQNVFQFPATFHLCRLLECFPLAPLQHYVVRETTQI